MATIITPIIPNSQHSRRAMPRSLIFVPRFRKLTSSLLSDGVVFASGAAAVLLLFWAVPSSLLYIPSMNYNMTSTYNIISTPSTTFYDDSNLSYNIDSTINNWDSKRQRWLSLNPSFTNKNNVLMLTGSQPGPCKSKVGDHLLLRFYKNKADYCRRHGMQLFYNMALFQVNMHSYWSKTPTIKAAMLAHPEVEWIWWVDSDAAITDMDFSLPFDKYSGYNLVVHGWPDLLYEKRSWVSLNAGVFLMRNCQWSLDLIDAWAAMGPQTPAYEHWGRVLQNEFKDKLFPQSDDQSGLAYLLVKQHEKWADKVYLENEYYFEGYWVEIVGRLENISNKYIGMERRVEKLRKRHAEVAAADHGRIRNEELEKEGAESSRSGWRRPFITHFTGCQPCSGDHNEMYTGQTCYEGMQKALNFGDDQVLREYGFRHDGLLSDVVRPLPFDYPSEI